MLIRKKELLGDIVTTSWIEVIERAPGDTKGASGEGSSSHEIGAMRRESPLGVGNKKRERTRI